MFETERFVEECRSALRESNPQAAVHELVKRAVSQPGEVIAALGEPQRAGVTKIHEADDLTILNLCWGPNMYLGPHDHRLWAVIGIYGGHEDNTFYRRSDDGLTTHGTKALEVRDTVPLGENIIHSVKNPLSQITGAIHVYGGNFFTKPRSEWTEDFKERPYSVEGTMRAFEESNALLDQEAKQSD